LYFTFFISHLEFHLPFAFVFAVLNPLSVCSLQFAVCSFRFVFVFVWSLSLNLNQQTVSKANTCLSLHVWSCQWSVASGSGDILPPNIPLATCACALVCCWCVVVHVTRPLHHQIPLNSKHHLDLDWILLADAASATPVEGKRFDEGGRHLKLER
jgi:hypothetical protein